MLEGVDSSSSIPVQVLKDNGKQFIIRYVSTPGNPKNITAEEVRSYLNNGIDLGIVYETTADWVLGGYHAGVIAGNNARGCLDVAQLPLSGAVYFAIDFGVAQSQYQVIADCFRGIQSVIPIMGIGCYAASGEYGIIPYLRSLSLISKAWQSGEYVNNPDVHQYNIDTPSHPVRMAGYSVDYDRAYSADFGQWPSASSHIPTPPTSPAPSIPLISQTKEQLIMSPTPVAIDACIRPGHAPQHWVLHSDGGVFSYGAPFYGSYPGLPPQDRQDAPGHVRRFISISPDPDGNGYTIFSDDGSYYHFR